MSGRETGARSGALFFIVLGLLAAAAVGLALAYRVAAQPLHALGDELGTLKAEHVRNAQRVARLDVQERLLEVSRAFQAYQDLLPPLARSGVVLREIDEIPSVVGLKVRRAQAWRPLDPVGEGDGPRLHGLRREIEVVGNEVAVHRYLQAVRSGSVLVRVERVGLTAVAPGEVSAIIAVAAFFQ